LHADALRMGVEAWHTCQGRHIVPPVAWRGAQRRPESVIRTTAPVGSSSRRSSARGFCAAASPWQGDGGTDR